MSRVNAIREARTDYVHWHRHDANGNLLQTNSWGGSPLHDYDAWNRLAGYDYDVAVTASRYDYPHDALHRRVVEWKFVDYGGSQPSDPEIARVDLYYSNRWQVIEDRSEHSAVSSETTITTNNAYVWSPGYVDDLVLRDRKVSVTEGESTTETEERLYAQHDHNFNVTSLVSTSGSVQDRIVYDPYGAWTAYDGTYASAAATRLTDKGAFPGLEDAIRQALEGELGPLDPGTQLKPVVNRRPRDITVGVEGTWVPNENVRIRIEGGVRVRGRDVDGWGGASIEVRW